MLDNGVTLFITTINNINITSVHKIHQKCPGEFTQRCPREFNYFVLANSSFMSTRSLPPIWDTVKKCFGAVQWVYLQCTHPLLFLDKKNCHVWLLFLSWLTLSKSKVLQILKDWKKDCCHPIEKKKFLKVISHIHILSVKTHLQNCLEFWHLDSKWGKNKKCIKTITFLWLFNIWLKNRLHFRKTELCANPL